MPEGGDAEFLELRIQLQELRVCGEIPRVVLDPLGVGGGVVAVGLREQLGHKTLIELDPGEALTIACTHGVRSQAGGLALEIEGDRDTRQGHGRVDDRVLRAHSLGSQSPLDEGEVGRRALRLLASSLIAQGHETEIAVAVGA